MTLPKNTPKQRVKRRVDAALRDYVWTRDGYRCQRCQKPLLRGGDGEVSHVLSRAKSVKLKYHPANVKLLCRECHRWWHRNGRESLAWFILKWPDRWENIQKVIDANDWVYGSVGIEWFQTQLEKIRKMTKVLKGNV